MSRKPQRTSPPRPATGPPRYRLDRGLVKWSVVFAGLLGAASSFADWSAWLATLQERTKAESWTVFAAYAAWMAMGLGYEAARVKVRRDLYFVQIEERQRVRGRRRRNPRRFAADCRYTWETAHVVPG